MSAETLHLQARMLSMIKMLNAWQRGELDKQRTKAAVAAAFGIAVDLSSWAERASPNDRT